MKISKVEQIEVHLHDPARLLEKATTRAKLSACAKFGIDDYGNSDKVEQWDRSSCSIAIEFESLRMEGGHGGGWSHTVTFKAWCEKETA